MRHLLPSSHAAQAAPPRITPGTVYAAGCATHTALRADSRRNGPEGRSLPPRACRGKHLAKPVLHPALGGLAQAPAGLSGYAPSRASASRPFGFNLPSPCSACRKVKGTCSTSPQAATCCTLKPIQRRPAARHTGVHGPFDAPRGALWGPRCGACTAGSTFSWSSPAFLCSSVSPPSLGKSPAPAGSGVGISSKPRIGRSRPPGSVYDAFETPAGTCLSPAPTLWVRRHRRAEKGGQA